MCLLLFMQLCLFKHQGSVERELASERCDLEQREYLLWLGSCSFNVSGVIVGAASCVYTILY